MIAIDKHQLLFAFLTNRTPHYQSLATSSSHEKMLPFQSSISLVMIISIWSIPAEMFFVTAYN